MQRSAIALVAATAAAFCVMSNSAFADPWRLPDGNDNLMPRYYDYRTPNVFYFDEAPVAFAVHGYAPAYAVGSPPPAAAYVPPPPVPPVYLPAGAYPPTRNLPPAYGYAPPAQLSPVVPVAPRPICGVYRFWSGDRCIDARGD